MTVYTLATCVASFLATMVLNMEAKRVLFIQLKGFQQGLIQLSIRSLNSCQIVLARTVPMWLDDIVMLFQVSIYFSHEHLIISMYFYRFNAREKSSKPTMYLCLAYILSHPTDLYRVHCFRFNPKFIVIVEIEYSMNCQFALYV